MALASRIDPRVWRKVLGSTASAVLHLALLFVILSGGRHDGIYSGDTRALKVVFTEAPDADRRDGEQLPQIEPTTPTELDQQQLDEAFAKLAAPVAQTLDFEPPAPEAAPPPPTVEPPADSVAEIPATLAMSDVERATLVKQLERFAEAALETSQSEVNWEQDGRKYSAVLRRERANDGTALERVIAEVSASDRGRHLTTLVNLRRLAFSQFTQMIDHWDPTVQLHDDEIVGRFHSNSRFNMMYDSRTAPKFFGKVTTSARSFSADSNGRRRDADIFRGGIETGASPIPLPEELQPFEWAPRDAKARIHEFTIDTHVRFFGDGSYSWRDRESSAPKYLNQPSEYPVYFLAGRDATLYVQGVVAGKVLVYSPRKIVIEGSLTYANDPRRFPDSRDYLGLVSDRYVEVASPGATGPGDLEIDAAIFAGRRFNVTSIDHPRTATLRIYGSLAAGTISATEPRYATKIDYDSRFERRRPPGFPSTNRYEAAEWNGQWSERPERTADGQ